MRILVVLLFFLLTLNADETLTRLFEQLKTVEKDEKFKVVNEIKKHIIALKEQERVEAIKLLQAKKSVEQKKAEVKNPNHPHSEDAKEMHDGKMDAMPKMENMPKNMNQMNNMRNMNGMKNLNTMQNIKNIQNLPVTQRGRRGNRENMREGMGRR